MILVAPVVLTEALPQEIVLTESIRSAATAGSLRRAYEARLDDGWEEDEAQEAALGALGRLLDSLSSPTRRPVKGLYLYGPVGRGKSQLLNMFMEHASGVPSRRTHMHAFMTEIHQRLFDIKSGDPVVQVAREIADAYRLFGFDEFYITNIADAMLLGRLFEHLFKYGVVIVATSNWPMEDLYQGGRNRKSFMPFIRVLERNMQAIDLGDGQDYRQSGEGVWPLFVVSDDPEAGRAELLSIAQRYGSESGRLVENGETSATDSIAWYRFEALCEQPLGRQEYTELLHNLDTLVIEGMPALKPDHSEVALRFVTLIDLCYEQHRRVIVSAEAYPDALYVEGPVLTAFQRASSRLAEMQRWA